MAKRGPESRVSSSETLDSPEVKDLLDGVNRLMEELKKYDYVVINSGDVRANVYAMESKEITGLEHIIIYFNGERIGNREQPLAMSIDISPKDERGNVSVELKMDIKALFSKEREHKSKAPTETVTVVAANFVINPQSGEVFDGANIDDFHGFIKALQKSVKSGGKIMPKQKKTSGLASILPE